MSSTLTKSTPQLGDEREDAVVVGLRAGLRHVDAVHVRVPGADVDPVGDVAAAMAAAEDRQVAVDGQPRNAAHQMDAEAQPEAVDVVGERPEAGAVRRRREAVERGKEPPQLVHLELGADAIVEAGGARLVPLDVDGEDVIAVRQQLLGHDFAHWRGPAPR